MMVKEQKLNILFLSSWYPNRVLPTNGNFVQKHAEAVALKSNVIALFVCSDTSCKKTIEVTEQTINNVFTIIVYYKKEKHFIPVFSFVQKCFRYVRAYSRGFKIVRKHFKRIDLVHHNILYPTGIIALYLNYFKRIPYVVTEHWTGYLPASNIYKGFLRKTITKKIANKASYLIPVSKDLQTAMEHHGFKSNYSIIPNVADVKLFYPLSTKSNNGKIKLLHISTLNDVQKNISGMLRTIAKLSEQRTDFEMWFIGDGDTAPHIKKAMEQGIYNSTVFFDGTKTISEVADIMRNADCFVLFSNYENLPCVMIEALASGIPIVATAIGGIPEHIDSISGILVEPGDEEELLNSLNKIFENIRAGKYDAQQLSNYAKANFSYEKVSEQFHMLYQKVLKN